MQDPLLTGLFLLLFAAVGWMWRQVREHPARVAAVMALYAAISVVGWSALVETTAGVGSAAGLVCLVWWQVARPSFTERVKRPVREWWLRRYGYGRSWVAVMDGCGLTHRSPGRRISAPWLELVRELPWSDRLVVALLPGQAPLDFMQAAGRIAEGFGSSTCKVTAIQPGLVGLELSRRGDPLARPFALSVPDRREVRLDGVPVGMRGDGMWWRIPVLGHHVLITGATGAGKGSVQMGLVRGLAPVIADGTVRVWAIDPKGGMELAGALPLFSRFATSSETAAELLEAAVERMQERTSRLAGVTRQHQPSPRDPLYLILVDELAALVSYEPDTGLRKRITAALELLLSQGRAVGFCVVASVQDPRKSVVGFRDLFTHRVALRMNEAAQVDLVLGDGAHDQGAVCEAIPDWMPGTGYVRTEPGNQIQRVRAAMVSDADIATLGVYYPAPPAAPEEGTHGEPVS